MTAFYGKHNNDSNQQSTLALDDSIEEMTSMFIDDTAANQLTGEPRKRLSKLGSAKIPQQTSRQGLFNDKALPRLPQLSFNGEDDWTTRSRAATEAISNEVGLVSDEEEFDSCPPPVSREPTHARKSSAPPLPRKSSKRRSRQREQKEVVDARNATGDDSRQIKPWKLSKTTQQSLKSPFSLPSQNTNSPIPKAAPDASQQIEAMLATSKVLKPEVDTFAIDSPVLSNKGDVKGNRVLSKMKNAITGHLRDKSHRKHHNLAKNEHLLDPNLSQLPDYGEEASTISAMKIRINEGWHFVRVRPDRTYD